MTDHSPAVKTRTEAGGRCLHDMLPGHCAPCLGHDLNVPADLDRPAIRPDAHVDVIVDRTLRALFEGRCALNPTSAAHAIEVGDVIGSTDIGYVCRDCVSRLA